MDLAFFTKLQEFKEVIMGWVSVGTQVQSDWTQTDNQAVDFIKNKPAYKIYRALLTQSGTNAPVATVLENTLGGEVACSYNFTGEYFLTLSGAFPANKLFIPYKSHYITQSGDDGNFIYKNRVSDDVISLSTYVSDSPSNDVLSSYPIEIIVYI